MAGGVRFRRAFLLILVVGISLLFLMVIRPFLLSVLLAAILAGLTYPLYRWIRNRVGDRENLGAVLTLIVLLLGVGLPMAGFLAIVANEAVQVSQGAETWFQEQDDLIGQVRGWVERLPYADRLLPEEGELAAQFRSVIEKIGPALMGKLAQATRITLAFFLQLFVLLYALFFFLVDGPEILRAILRYLPLGPEQEEALLERFVSVTRATLKGSLLIGVIQGALAGVAFWVAGVPGAAFWATVMVVLSIIPALGAAFVWVPAVIYLFVVGDMAAGIGLLIWCAIVVSTVDNFLRPRLVGRDARMSDLLILLSTLGGIVLFGVVGFIVGPIVAALFVTIWHIYGETFLQPDGRRDGPRVPRPAGGAALQRPALDAPGAVGRAQREHPGGEAR
jgi:predicted PurR-regulated permease PerM